MDKYELLFQFNKSIFRAYGRLLSLKRYNTTRKMKPILTKNIELISKKRSNKCFVIGLGPSLKNIDLSKLDGDLIVTNRFFRVAGSQNVKPTLYVLCDNAFFEKEHKDDLEKAFKTYPESAFLLNGLYADNVKKRYPHNKNLYYLLSWKGFINGDKDVIDCTRVLPMSTNVVCTALFAAIYMGYETIELLGCDFNSFASSKQVHVYEDTNNKRLWSMSNELFQYSFTADLHNQINIYANKHNCKIYNSTAGSLIDAYEKKDDHKYRYNEQKS